MRIAFLVLPLLLAAGTGAAMLVGGLRTQRRITAVPRVAVEAAVVSYSNWTRSANVVFDYPGPDGRWLRARRIVGVLGIVLMIGGAAVILFGLSIALTFAAPLLRRPPRRHGGEGRLSRGYPRPEAPVNRRRRSRRERAQVDLFEYQARDVFESHQVPVLRGLVATTPEEARAAAEELGGGTVVVKAQVKTGGRGKAGGVKLAHSPDEAQARARDILGMDIKGHTVHRVMIAEGASIAEEYYVALLLDRSERRYLAMASVEGGVEIEQLAVDRPEALAKVAVDPRVGIDQAKATEIVQAAGFADDVAAQVVEVLQRLWDVYRGEDATLVEVNPLVRTADGRVIALDGKVTLDDNAAFRHPHHAGLIDTAATDPLEAKAAEHDLNYVKLDGSVGIIGNGAGLVMSTLDVVAAAGQRHGGVAPANFLDIGGGASAEVMAAGLDVILGDPQVRAVFVNVFGGITACDAVATGIVQALEILGDHATKPLVVRLDGNNVAEGRRILSAADHPLVTLADTMDGGADKAAELAHASA